MRHARFAMGATALAAIVAAPLCAWAGQGPGGQGFPGGQGMPGGQGFPGMGPGQMMGPGMRQAPAPAMATAGEYVYVLRGNTLTQFSTKSLEIVKKVTIEPERPMMPPMPGMAPGMPGPGFDDGPRGPSPGQAPSPEAQAPDQAPGRPGQGGPGFNRGPGMPGGQGFPGMGMGMPPMMGMPAPAVLTATVEHVFVLRGNTLYQFAARGLTLLKKAGLADDMPPMMGMGGQAGRPQGGPGGPTRRGQGARPPLR